MQRRSPKPRGQTQEERASSTGEDRWVTRSSWAVPREILWLNHSYWPPSQGWSTQQGRASSGKQKPLLCCQPETFLIALLVLSSSSIQLHISPSQRNVTLVQKLSKDNKDILLWAQKSHWRLNAINMPTLILGLWNPAKNWSSHQHWWKTCFLQYEQDMWWVNTT